MFLFLSFCGVLHIWHTTDRNEWSGLWVRREVGRELKCHVTRHCLWYGNIGNGAIDNSMTYRDSWPLEGTHVPGNLRSLLLSGISSVGHSQLQTGLPEGFFFFALIKMFMTMDYRPVPLSIPSCSRAPQFWRMDAYGALVEQWFKNYPRSDLNDTEMASNLLPPLITF